MGRSNSRNAQRRRAETQRVQQQAQEWRQAPRLIELFPFLLAQVVEWRNPQPDAAPALIMADHLDERGASEFAAVVRVDHAYWVESLWALYWARAVDWFWSAHVLPNGSQQHVPATGWHRPGPRLISGWVLEECGGPLSVRALRVACSIWWPAFGPASTDRLSYLEFSKLLQVGMNCEQETPPLPESALTYGTLCGVGHDVPENALERLPPDRWRPTDLVGLTERGRAIYARMVEERLRWHRGARMWRAADFETIPTIEPASPESPLES